MWCNLCGEFGHAQEDCHMHSLGDLIDRVFDQMRDAAMVVDEAPNVLSTEDQDN